MRRRRSVIKYNTYYGFSQRKSASVQSMPGYLRGLVSSVEISDSSQWRKASNRTLRRDRCGAPRTHPSREWDADAADHKKRLLQRLVKFWFSLAVRAARRRRTPAPSIRTHWYLLWFAYPIKNKSSLPARMLIILRTEYQQLMKSECLFFNVE